MLIHSHCLAAIGSAVIQRRNHTMAHQVAPGRSRRLRNTRGAEIKLCREDWSFSGTNWVLDRSTGASASARNSCRTIDYFLEYLSRHGGGAIERAQMSTKRIWVAGHNGMVGSAITRYLTKRGDDVLKAGREVVDLRDQLAVEVWLKQNRPEAIVFAAAKVGGIYANHTYPADFIYDNLAIEANVIHSAHLAGVDRLVFLGSSCIYPKFAPQPITEDALLTGPLEPTNEWYAIAKIAGIKLCQAYRKQYGRSYISVMPCNLYGPGDNLKPQRGHCVASPVDTRHAR